MNGPSGKLPEISSLSVDFRSLCWVLWHLGKACEGEEQSLVNLLRVVLGAEDNQERGKYPLTCESMNTKCSYLGICYIYLTTKLVGKK